MVIRIATLADLDAMVGLLGELFSIESDFSVNPDVQRQGVALMLADERTRCVMVAEEQGQVVGMVTLQMLISTAEGGRVGLIEDMVVTSTYRGRGIGKQLLSAMEFWAKERGLLRLQLLADRKNAPALEFYRRQHWRQTDLICLRKK
jgi:ribosomal protein S18 acetylase RimI-like enzyme